METDMGVVLVSIQVVKEELVRNVLIILVTTIMGKVENSVAIVLVLTIMTEGITVRVLMATGMQKVVNVLLTTLVLTTVDARNARITLVTIMTIMQKVVNNALIVLGIIIVGKVVSANSVLASIMEVKVVAMVVSKEDFGNVHPITIRMLNTA